MCTKSTQIVENPANDPVLLRTLKAAGLPVTGTFRTKAGWVSRVWIGEDYVVRVSNERFRDAFRHEASVINLLAGSAVPHARIIALGEGPDGPWCVSTRLRGQTLHEAWPSADKPTRQSIIESLGVALRALHQVPAPDELLPPWLERALNGGPRSAFHPPVVGAALQQIDEARHVHGSESPLLAEVSDWVQQRLPLFKGEPPVLVHGDLHGSNVIVDGGHVTGIIDFAEALAQPADVELDTILRWCARAREYPPVPEASGLDESTLIDVLTWLRGAYPELFAHEHLRDRLRFYDMQRELAIYTHHPEAEDREAARIRITDLIAGRNHLDRLVW